MTQSVSKLARDVAIGDVLCDGRGPRARVTAVRPVLTTSAGRPRRQAPVQVTIESEHLDTHALESATVGLETRVRVRV